MKSEILWVLKNTPFIITNSEDVTAAVGDKVKYTLKVSGGSCAIVSQYGKILSLGGTYHRKRSFLRWLEDE